jgi:hypothetical protein
MVDRAATLLRAFSTGLAMLAAAAPIARAELVIFTNGRVVKALSHQAAGDRIEILLLGGGSYTFDRTLVERIGEDEVAAADVQAPPQAPLQPPRQTPRHVKKFWAARNEQAATPMAPQEPAPARQASEENRPVPQPTK